LVVRALSCRHLLGVLKEAAVEQIDGDPGRAEAVATQASQKSCFLGAANDHPPRVLTGQAIAGELLEAAAAKRAEERHALFAGEAGGPSHSRRDSARADGAPASRAACRLFRAAAPTSACPAGDSPRRSCAARSRSGRSCTKSVDNFVGKLADGESSCGQCDDGFLARDVFDCTSALHHLISRTQVGKERRYQPM
jgi:hypothetical protein